MLWQCFEIWGTHATPDKRLGSWSQKRQCKAKHCAAVYCTEAATAPLPPWNASRLVICDQKHGVESCCHTQSTICDLMSHGVIGQREMPGAFLRTRSSCFARKRLGSPHDYSSRNATQVVETAFHFPDLCCGIQKFHHSMFNI